MAPFKHNIATANHLKEQPPECNTRSIYSAAPWRPVYLKMDPRGGRWRWRI